MTDLRPIEILLIEDNPADAHLTVSALRDAKILNHIHLVGDGEEALGFLRQEGKYSDAPRPHLVFLDLNIPKIDGHAILNAMKADNALRRIPVVVISSSNSREDVDKAYDEQVSFYLVKPLDVDQYFTAIRSMKELWFHVVALPSSAEATAS